MLRLLMVRHGRTRLNAQGRFQGQLDEPLDDTGRQQAHALGARLRNEKFDEVISSDLRRSLETAAIVAGVTGPAPRQVAGLREMAFGRWEGLAYDDIRQTDDRRLADWEADLLHVAPPGGETLAQFAERVEAAWRPLAEVAGERTILLVAHAGVLQLILCQALGLTALDYWHFRLDTASLSEIQYYPAGPIIQRLNDTSHLDRLDGGPAGRVSTPA